MKKLPAKELKDLFCSSIDGFEVMCEEGNPFLFKKGEFRCYVFLKNISPAYFVNRPNITRVQLPSSARFKQVISHNLRFIILGYDADNEVFVSWNPNNVKDRLNTKANVSLYSRLDLQTNVNEGEFKFGFLSNGEKIVLFRKSSLMEFFTKIDTLFDENNKTYNTKETTRKEKKKTIQVDEEKIKALIEPLLKANRVLQAVSLLAEEFKDDPTYKNLTFKDWFGIVNIIYKDSLEE
jgi:hypothetical protein